MAERGMWSSRLAFILAAAGAAVGLGNIWGFPTQAGQGGGAAFVLVYLFCVLLICMPILAAEVVLGRGSQRSVVGAFEFFRPGTKWWLVGILGVATGVGILGFYSVVAGWTVAYIWFVATGAVSASAEDAGSFFTEFTARGPLSIALAFVFIALTAATLLGGVRAGIERASKTLMPILIVLLLVLCARALTLPGAAEGLSYYLKPDFSRVLDPAVFNIALGQAFFSLSIGMGAMLTYGSYLSRKESIGKAVLWVVALDTGIALLAGLIVFPAGFSIAGFDPTSSGPGLIFTVFPRIFATIPAGALFGTAFFVLLTTAGLTSTIATLEVPVAYLIDERGWSRVKSVLVASGLAFALAIPCALGNGAVDFWTDFTSSRWGGNFLGFMIVIWNNFALPIGGFLIAIFVAHVWRVDKALEELLAENAWFPAPALWGFLIRIVSPVAIAVILVMGVWPLFFG